MNRCSDKIASNHNKDLQHRSRIDSSSIDSTSSSSMNRKSYPNSDINTSFSSSSVSGSIQDDKINDQRSLTQAELEKYSRSYFGQQVYHHQKQSSYAQSEGYHSYVSSSDSSSATPFLDRLRQESELLSRLSHCSQLSDLHQSAASISNQNLDGSNSESCTSSAETIKWLGSMSDVSVGDATNSLSTLSGSVSSSHLIVHSSRVRTPKRHHSESVLYITNEDQRQAECDSSDSKRNSPCERSSRNNNRLFPVSTYNTNSGTSDQQSIITSKSQNTLNNVNNNWQSVADRISELERQHSSQHNNNEQNQKYTFLDPSKTTRVHNPTLKAFQKNAVQSYFERQTSTTINSRHSLESTLHNSNPIISGQSNANTSITAAQQQRSSLPTNYSQMNNLNNNIDSLKSTAQTSISTTQTLPSSTIGELSIQSSPIVSRPIATCKLLSSPTYQATNYTHLPATIYNVPILTQRQEPYNNINCNTNSSKSMLSSKILMVEDGCLQAANESGVPPPPPRRSKPTMLVRRTSSASNYAKLCDQTSIQKHCLSKDLLKPMVMGPIISLDDWVPERPPKNPMLRVPSPDLPPPPPAIHTEWNSNTINQDEPLPPPPPPELLRHTRQQSEAENKINIANRRNSFAGSTSKKTYNVSQSQLVHPPPSVLNKSVDLSQKRSVSSLGKHPPALSCKPNKNIINGKLESPAFHTSSTPAVQLSQRTSDTRLSLKRSSQNAQTSLLSSNISKNITKTQTPANNDQNNHSIASSLGSRIQYNSKASYRLQPMRDKKNLELDHGRYRLTSPSTEELPVNSNSVYKHQQNYYHKNVNKSEKMPMAEPCTPASGDVLEQSHQHGARSTNLQIFGQQRPTVPSIISNKDGNVLHKNSLKENIDKITQLQTKLMSAHLNENNEKIVSNSRNESSFCNNSCSNASTTEQLTSSLPSALATDTIGMSISTLPNYEDHSSILISNEISETNLENKTESTSSSIIADHIASTSMNDENISDNSKHNLQLLQITESRLSTLTSEAASQTDNSLLTMTRTSNLVDNIDSTNALQEISHIKYCDDDFDLKKLLNELLNQLCPTDRLHQILVPYRSSVDYIAGLYNPYIVPRLTKKEVGTSTPDIISPECSSSLNSNVSALKKYSPIQRYNLEINGDVCDLTLKKEELMQKIRKQLLVLANEQSTVSDDTTANDMLGNDVAIKVCSKIRPIDVSKFRSYVDDVGHITMLLLSLGGRLAKIENAIKFSDNTDENGEKKMLELKRDRLMEQLDEAKRLKTDIDRRGNVVCTILKKHLSIEDYADYDYFINMKAKLIVDLREITDKIKVGEEQLSILQETLVHSEC